MCPEDWEDDLFCERLAAEAAADTDADEQITLAAFAAELGIDLTEENA